MPALQRTGKEIAEIYNRHVDAVYRVSYSFMKNKADAEDAVQETFLRLLSCGKVFENERHERAWLIITASNICKDNLKKWWRKAETIDDYSDTLAVQETPGNDVTRAILELPAKYKTVVYLYYYEGYSTKEIAMRLGCSHGTVRSQLARARDRLNILLGGNVE
jgi:RNA polymerase sigma-70 factor (ECF subfamily)